MRPDPAQPIPPAMGAPVESRRPRALVLLNRVPLPPDDGWKRRTVATIDQIAIRYRTILVINAPVSDEDRATMRERWGADTDIVGVRERRSQTIARLRSLVTRRPYLVEYEETPQYVSAVRQAIAAHGEDDLDLCFCVSLAMCAVARAAGVKARRLVVDTHNVDSEFLDRLADRTSSAPARYYIRYSARRMAHYESWVARQAHELWVCSDREVDLLRERGLTNIVAVPNGVDTSDLAPEPHRDSASLPTLAFFGHLEYRPNLDAIEYLVTDIVPVLRRSLPAFRILVFGAGNSQAAARQVAGVPEVTLLGSVPSVAATLMEASMSVVPLRIGGGTRLKVLEALACGIPVVSTRLGSEGIPAVHGESILFADTPVEFADQIARLIADPAFAATVGRNGQALVLSQFTWERLLRVHFDRQLPPTDVDIVDPRLQWT